MDLRPVSSDEQWRTLLGARPDATLYHTMPWLRFQERQFGFELCPLVAYREGMAVGVFPLFLARRGVFRVSGSPRGIDTLFLGPLIAPPLLPDLLDAYEVWVRRNRVDHSAIAFAKEIDEEVATSRGYVHERQRNAVVSLEGGEEAVWNRLTSECRRRIRQARKRGVEIVEGDLTSYLDRYAALSAEIFAKSGAKSELTPDVLTDMLAALADAGELLTLRAEVDGRVVAMYIGAAYRKTFYAVDTVSDRRFRKYPASNLMNWQCFAWGCARGLEAFDFQGANITEPGQLQGFVRGPPCLLSQYHEGPQPVGPAGDPAEGDDGGEAARVSVPTVEEGAEAGRHEATSTAVCPGRIARCPWKRRRLATHAGDGSLGLFGI